MLLHLSRVCGATRGHAGSPHLVCLTFAALERLRKQPAVISANFLIRQPFALHFLSDTFRLLPHLKRALPRALSLRTRVPLQQQEVRSLAEQPLEESNKQNVWRGLEDSGGGGRRRVCVSVYMFH